MTTDILMISGWLVILLALAVIGFGLVWPLLRRLGDGGFGVAGVAAIVALSWISWILASIKVFPFSLQSVLVGFMAITALSIVSTLKYRRDLRQWIISHHKIIIFELILFLVSFIGWSYIRSFQPDIEGLEKFMDAGFVNSILKSDWMPPADPWFANQTINYYYFGHFEAAVLTKLSGIELAYAYNLLLATVFSLSMLAGFSVVYAAVGPSRAAAFGGLTATLLLNFGGNLQTLWHLLTQPDKPYWYPDATRFIPYTIHEFPAYSHVVADLHGHLLNLPTVLLFLTLLISMARTTAGGWATAHRVTVLVIGSLLGIMSMTNTWDVPIYATVFSFCWAHRYGLQLKSKLSSLVMIASKDALSILVSAVVVSWPYHLNFDSIAQGIALVEARSPLWQLVILWGGFAAIGVVAWWWFSRRRQETDEAAKILVPAMIIVSAILIVIPEVIYVKDIYIKEYHRANTMFKLTYQSFVMMSLVFGMAVGRIVDFRRATLYPGRLIAGLVLLAVFIAHMLYPGYSIKGYYGLSRPRKLYGLDWLARSAPDDWLAVGWLNQSVENQETILEAVGESYTTYARFSTFTGLPTVLGWRVHEWLWRGGFDEVGRRTEEVRLMYESPLSPAAAQLFVTYNIRFVVVGSLERQAYRLDEAGLLSLGQEVFRSGDTRLIKI